jgi:DNA-binding MarR family transcriptional regulator
MNQFRISEDGFLTEALIHDAVVKTVADHPSVDPLAVESVRMITAVFGALVREIAPIRSEFSLSGARYSVLRALIEAEDDALSIGEVARRLAVTPPNVSKLIDGLVSDGLVERQRLPSDRRVVQVAITEKGREGYVAVTPPTLHSFDDALSGLTAEDKRLLIHLLAKLRLSMQARPRVSAPPSIASATEATFEIS